jgi:hypothetical protein
MDQREEEDLQQDKHPKKHLKEQLDHRQEEDIQQDEDVEEQGVGAVLAEVLLEVLLEALVEAVLKMLPPLVMLLLVVVLLLVAPPVAVPVAVSVGVLEELYVPRRPAVTLLLGGSTPAFGGASRSGSWSLSCSYSRSRSRSRSRSKSLSRSRRCGGLGASASLLPGLVKPEMKSRDRGRRLVEVVEWMDAWRNGGITSKCRRAANNGCTTVLSTLRASTEAGQQKTVQKSINYACFEGSIAG